MYQSVRLSSLLAFALPFGFWISAFIYAFLVFPPNRSQKQESSLLHMCRCQFHICYFSLLVARFCLANLVRQSAQTILWVVGYIYSLVHIVTLCPIVKQGEDIELLFLQDLWRSDNTGTTSDEQQWGREECKPSEFCHRSVNTFPLLYGGSILGYNGHDFMLHVLGKQTILNTHF